MAINLSDSIRVGQQKPVDDKYYNGLSLYASTTEVNSSIDSAVRYVGLTVAIDDGSGGAVEYWYKTGILDTDLVVKQSGGTGTVTSVALTVPSGLQVTGSPITTHGTLDVTFATGYSIPTTASQSNWNTAYSWGNHADGGYITTETDPVFSVHTTSNIINGTGFLVNNGSGTWSYDNSTYLTTVPSNLTLDYISFNTSVTPEPSSVGDMWWSVDHETVYLQLDSGEKMRVGQDHYIRVIAGVDILKGDVVKFTGATGDTAIAGLANGSSDEPYTLIGVAAEDISSGQSGFVMQFGDVDQFDTSTPGWTLGNLLYVNPLSPGKLTNTMPSAPNWNFPIAAVTRVSNAGRIKVRAIPGTHVHDIVDVNITSISDNEILQWNNASSYWENRTFAEADIQTASGAASTYLTISTAASTYQPIGSYLTSESDPIYTASSWYTTTNNASNWDTAYSWGNHASAGYLTSYTETDPIVGGINGIVMSDGAGNITAASAGTDYILNVSEDLTPTLGGDLDANNYQITNLARINGTPTSTIISGAALGSTALQSETYIGTVTSVSGTGTIAGLTLTGTVTSSGSLTLGGTLDIEADATPTLGGDLTCNQNNITDANTITSDNYVATTNALTASTYTSWDVNDGTFATLRLNQDITQVIINNMTAGMTAVIIVEQTASYAITAFTNGSANYVKWSNGVSPIITTTSGKFDVISFISDGTYIYGSFLQNF